jgi:hypothetical protein
VEKLHASRVQQGELMQTTIQLPLALRVLLANTGKINHGTAEAYASIVSQALQIWISTVLQGVPHV